MEINYIGEHILAGRMGSLGIYLSFLTALLATIFFILSSSGERFKWIKPYARALFVAHTGFLMLAMGALYYLIYSHAFEFHYVWEYSSKSLPFHFLMSAFWAGQEGSFIIWAFFQAMLGIILLKKSTKWQSPAMGIISLAQTLLLVTVLGLKLGTYTLGSSPFQLIREMAVNLSNPLFSNPNYLSFITDGNGLNPLLENIWMAIHPPLLFLGYAACLIPFSIAFAGFWNKDYESWLKPALPWAGFAALSLGIGIILGGAWAYVDLTFGGFWAWDPVENASLVPWLLIVATLHFMLISKRHKQYLRWSLLLSGLSYILVLYASYLTRSGVLKDTSAHAFGDEGRAIPLLIYIYSFVMVTVGTFLIRRPGNTIEKAKENLTSREFWIFVGAIVLILSSFQVIITTSIPVLNNIFGSQLAPPIENVAYYNKWQLPYGIMIALLIGVATFLRHGSTDKLEFLKKIIVPVVISFVILICAMVFFPFSKPFHYIFLFFLIFSISATVDQLFSKNKITGNTGALISHLGITIFLFAVLITFSNNNLISGELNQEGVRDEKTANQFLFRNTPTPLGKYQAVYTGYTQEDNNYIFDIDFYKPNSDGSNEKAFTLHPTIKHNEKMGNVFEPSISHYLSKDVYAVIVDASVAGIGNSGGYSQLGQGLLSKNQPLHAGEYQISLDSIMTVMPSQSDMRNVAISAKIIVRNATKSFTLTPGFELVNGNVNYKDAIIDEGNVLFRFEKISDAPETIYLGVYNKTRDYVVIRVMEFPWIIVLWIGSAITFLGFFISLYRRWKKSLVAV